VGLALSIPWIDICLPFTTFLRKGRSAGVFRIIPFSVVIVNFPIEPLSPHLQDSPFPKQEKLSFLQLYNPKSFSKEEMDKRNYQSTENKETDLCQYFSLKD